MPVQMLALVLVLVRWLPTLALLGLLAAVAEVVVVVVEMAMVMVETPP